MRAVKWRDGMEEAYSLPEVGAGRRLYRLPRMTPTRRWLVLLLLAGVCGCRRAAPESPDLILINGQIWTGDAARPDAEALAIRGGRIMTIGATDVVSAMASAETTVIDLHRRRVVPGFNDAHWHLPTRRTADLAGAGNPQEIVGRLTTFSQSLPAGAWVTGKGWGPSDFPDLQPHRRHLDAAFPSQPVVISDRDGHQVLVNSHVLAVARITRTTPDPPNGRIGRDASGAPTGLLQEAAASLVQTLLPPVSADEAYASLLSEMTKAAAFGLTSLQDATIGDDPAVRVGAYERARREGTLTVRVRVSVPLERDVTAARLAEVVALRDSHRDGLLSFGIAKGMLDGTVDGHTAALLLPYADRPAETGLLMWDQVALDAAVAAYDKAGLQVQLHAVGDRAIRMALDAFAQAARANATTERRHRIEHVELPSPDDLPRFRALGVIASTQAMFASPDAITLTSFAPALGPERASRADAFRQLDDALAVQAFGSDYPVFTMEVVRGIHAAVTRQLPDGTPAGGWYPANRISVAAALRHYTADAAWASFDETEKGTLSPGRFADLVVLSDDIFSVAPEKLPTVRPLLTMMGGKVTWQSPAWKTGRQGRLSEASLPPTSRTLR